MKMAICSCTVYRRGSDQSAANEFVESRPASGPGRSQNSWADMDSQWPVGYDCQQSWPGPDLKLQVHLAEPTFTLLWQGSHRILLETLNGCQGCLHGSDVIERS